MLNEDIMDTMVRMATDGMRNAYTGHGTIAVGACLLASDGTLYPGCTIDNSTPQVALTAEMVAVARAVADGKREFDGIAVVADTEEPYVPSGVSCELLAEFDVQEIVMANLKGDMKNASLDDLLPREKKRKHLVSDGPKFLFDMDENS